jgi:hypothetical protein
LNKYQREFQILFTVSVVVLRIIILAVPS